MPEEENRHPVSGNIFVRALDCAASRSRFPVWVLLIVLSLVLAASVGVKISCSYLSYARSILQVLAETWPDVRVRNGLFSVENAPALPCRIDLPPGWSVVLDPNNELSESEVEPGTIVLQQGRYIYSRFRGRTTSGEWHLDPDNNFTLTRRSFLLAGRWLNLALAAGVFLLALAIFCLLALLALVGSGFLLLLEFLRGPPAPEAVWSFSVFGLIVPAALFEAWLILPLRMPGRWFIFVSAYPAFLWVAWVVVRRARKDGEAQVPAA